MRPGAPWPIWSQAALRDPRPALTSSTSGRWVRARAGRVAPRSRAECSRRSRARLRSAHGAEEASRSGRCRRARHGSGRTRQPHRRSEGGRASAVPTRKADTYQKEARKETPRAALCDENVAVSSPPSDSPKGSNPDRRARSTCALRSPAGGPSPRGRTGSARTSPSGRDRGTVRFARSSSAGTRTRRPRRPHRSSCRRPRRSQPAAAALRVAERLACGLRA